MCWEQTFCWSNAATARRIIKEQQQQQHNKTRRGKKLFKANCSRNLSLCDNLVEQLILLLLVGWETTSSFRFSRTSSSFIHRAFSQSKSILKGWAHKMLWLTLFNCKMISWEEVCNESGRPDAIIYDKMIFKSHELN